MRVCIVLENHMAVQMGGAEYQAHLIAQELASRQGVEVIYLCRGDGSQTLPIQWPYQIANFGHPSGFRRRSLAFDAPALWRLLTRLQPDVIYQRMRQTYTAVCQSYSEYAKIPLVFHVASEGDLSRKLLGDRPLGFNLPFDVLDRMVGMWGLSRARHVVVQSRRQAAMLHRSFTKQPVAVVGNFHELPTALPKKPTSPIRVVWIANIKEIKQPEVFVEAAAAFNGRTDIEFVMVGRPSSKRRFHGLMKKIESMHNLRYLGALPLPNVNQLLAESHIFVQTSLREGFPNTFVQAWSHGAVVASLEVDVDDGMDSLGIGFRTGNRNALIGVIERLADDRLLREATANRAFDYVQANHSLRNGQSLADLIITLGTSQPPINSFSPNAR
jgi:glycosyltransferase involved in cell wall biosynthesis